MRYLLYKEDKQISYITPVPYFDQAEITEYAIVEELPEFDTKTHRLDLIRQKGEDQYSVTVVPLTKDEKAKVAWEDRTRAAQAIDMTTREEISKGFQFDGHTFSLSSNAQLNWQNLMLLHQSGHFKNQPISTLDNGTYHLTEDKLLDFFKAGCDRLAEILTNGRRKKDQLKLR